jgi:O-acetylserine/cysteine efflux transporter
MTSSHLSLRDTLLALLVVFVWGTNFVVVRWGLDMLPPLMMAAIRFALVLFPAIFFLKKPDVSWKLLGLYGFCLGTGQFGMLYMAMDGFISPGMASVVMQTQVFFTIAIAAQRTGEKPEAAPDAGPGPGGVRTAADPVAQWRGHYPRRAWRWCWAARCAGAPATRRRARRRTRPRRAAIPMNPLAFVVWASLFSPCRACSIMSLLLEGPARVSHGLAGLQAG